LELGCRLPEIPIGDLLWIAIGFDAPLL
jgi:hypothetical protein